MRAEQEIRTAAKDVEHIIDYVKAKQAKANNEMVFDAHKSVLAEMTERLNTLKWVLEE